MPSATILTEMILSTAETTSYFPYKFRYTKNAEYPISNFPIRYFRRIETYNDVISDKVGISDFNGKHDVVA